MVKNLAVKNNNNRQGLRVARAAETVSGELDKVIHERMRLGIISALAANTSVHLGPTSANRPFLTKGYPGAGGWQAKVAMKIIGSGIDVSHIITSWSTHDGPVSNPRVLDRHSREAA